MPAPVRAARFVTWAHAAHAGLASPDLAADRVAADDPPHRVYGLPDAESQSLAVIFARISAGAVGSGRPIEPIARLILPVPGDPSGLPGPGPLTDAALQHGEVALVRLPPTSADTWFGLVPVATPEDVQWHGYPVAAGPGNGTAVARGNGLPDLAQAERLLAEALREATTVLTSLDVAGPSPSRTALDSEARADQLDALRRGRMDGPVLAPGYPNRAHDVLARARRLRAIVDLATADDGAAVSRAEADARRVALRSLDRAARYAEMAAVNAAGEPGTATA